MYNHASVQAGAKIRVRSDERRYYWHQGEDQTHSGPSSSALGDIRQHVQVKLDPRPARQYLWFNSSRDNFFLAFLLRIFLKASLRPPECHKDVKLVKPNAWSYSCFGLGLQSHNALLTPNQCRSQTNFEDDFYLGLIYTAPGHSQCWEATYHDIGVVAQTWYIQRKVRVQQFWPKFSPSVADLSRAGWAGELDHDIHFSNLP